MTAVQTETQPTPATPTAPTAAEAAAGGSSPDPIAAAVDSGKAFVQCSCKALFVGDDYENAGTLHRAHVCPNVSSWKGLARYAIQAAAVVLTVFLLRPVLIELISR